MWFHKGICPFVHPKTRIQPENCADNNQHSVTTKGQLISKGLFGVIVWTKKPTKFFLRISALASKKRNP